MNRQDFYLNLALELNKLKVPPELINTHIEQFKQYLQTLSEEDAEKQIASFGPVADLAGNIFRLLSGDSAPAPAKAEKDSEESLYDAFRVEEDPDAVALAIEEMESEGAATDDYPVDDYPAEAPAQDAPSADTVIFDPAAEEVPLELDLDLDFDILDTEGYVSPDLSLFEDGDRGENETPPTPDETPEKTNEEPVTDEEPFEEFTFEDLPKHVPEKNKGGVMFWGLFTLALPVTAPLFIAIMALFGFTYVLIGLLVAVTFISIFACAIAGALLALTGGLYGVTQLSAGAMAIGLFELGMAITIAGITILCSYLLSLLSLRALPMLFKWLTRLLRLFLQSLLNLIDHLKGRCKRR